MKGAEYIQHNFIPLPPPKELKDLSLALGNIP